VKGDRHVYGILYDNFFKVYDGNWLNDKRNGVGVQYRLGLLNIMGNGKMISIKPMVSRAILAAATLTLAV
jgi:hypothetical protein